MTISVCTAGNGETNKHRKKARNTGAKKYIPYINRLRFALACQIIWQNFQGRISTFLCTAFSLSNYFAWYLLGSQGHELFSPRFRLVFGTTEKAVFGTTLQNT